jgi:hypothetical protein
VCDVLPAYIGSRRDNADPVDRAVRRGGSHAGLPYSTGSSCHGHPSTHALRRDRMGRPDSTPKNMTRRKPQYRLQSQVHECRGRSDVVVKDLIDETRRVAMMCPGASAFLGANSTVPPNAHGAAFKITIVSCFTETRERQLLRRIARDPLFSTERRTHKRCS